MPICIYCDKELDALEYHESGIAFFSFIEHPEKSALGYYGSLDFKNDGVGEYKRPGCKKTLFIDEGEAPSFLTSKAVDACELCHKEKGTEPIYDEETQRELWICTSCDSRIEWLPGKSSTSFMLTGGWKAGLGPAAGNPTQGTSLRDPALPPRTLKGGGVKNE